jgi:hypothetical protein
MAAPSARGVVDRDLDVDIELPSLAFEFSTIKDIIDTSRPVDYTDFAIPFALGKDLINSGTQRREA